MMSWKIDDIDFKNFGVGVIKSSGVLDMPRIVDESIDWLDLDGRDFWQQADKVKYQGREITLNCYIKADGYEAFKTKVNAFYEALVAPGERTLLTPYGNAIEHVTLQQKISMVRKTSYVSSLQIGMFTLRLTVAGDEQFNLITIYKANWEIQAIAKYYSDAKLESTLQGNNVVTFQAEFSTKPTLGRGDIIVVDGQEYFHLEYPEIIKDSPNKYVYNLTFEHKFNFLKDIRFKILGKAETAYWGNMQDVLNLIIENTLRSHPAPGMFTAGIVDETENRNHRFNCESCYDVLTRLASEYNLEFEYVMDPVTGIITLNVVKKIGHASTIILEYGKDNNAYTIKRIPTPREKLCTRLYAWGSNKNLPVGYPYERLALDAPIERPFFNMQIERDKVYDDIKPERTGTVTGYVKKTKPDTWVYAPGTQYSAKPIKIYTSYPNDNTYELTDTSMPFDLKEKDAAGNTVYLIAGTSAKIHFNTGDLAGYEFEVLDYDHNTFTFKLNPIIEAGVKLPSDTLKPAVGDKYVIIDINLPQSYVEDAKLRLYDAAYSSMFDGIDFNPPESDYEVDILPAFDFQALAGDTLQINEPDFATATLRIVNVTKNLYTGWKKVLLSPNLYKSNRQRLETKVADLERSVQASKLYEVNQTRGNEQTTREVKDEIIDPVDGLFRADDIVRSIDLTPRMLDFDSGTPQFSIKGAQVETNVDGNPNRIKIEAGEFINHSFFALEKSTIKQLKEAGVTYDPTRQWEIPETTIDLESEDEYFMYLKVPIDKDQAV